jgi:hypothetical protein
VPVLLCVKHLNAADAVFIFKSDVCFSEKKIRTSYEQTNKVEMPRDDHHLRKTNVFITTLYGRIYDLKLSGTSPALVFVEVQLVR